MKTISKAEAEQMIKQGYVFTPHNLYQNENTAVFIQLTEKVKKPFQVKENKNAQH